MADGPFDTYSTESVRARLDALGIPFAEHFARALVALLSARKISLHHVTHLMPGEQNPEANRMQVRRCLDHESLSQQTLSQLIGCLDRALASIPRNSDGLRWLIPPFTLPQNLCACWWRSPP